MVVKERRVAEQIEEWKMCGIDEARGIARSSPDPFIPIWFIYRLLCPSGGGKFSGVDQKTSNGMETRSSQTPRSIARG